MKRIFTTSIAVLGILLWMGVFVDLSAQQKEPVLIGAIQDLTGTDRSPRPGITPCH